MRREPSRRIDVQGVPTPLAGVEHALAHVRIPDDLPPGPSEAALPAPAAPCWKPGRVVLRRERAQRGGKTVIVVDGFATHLPATFIADVAKRLRAACGCGGTVRGRSVEIQGDQPGKVRTALVEQGFEVGGIS
jgi:translation initiation factor 1